MALEETAQKAAEAPAKAGQMLGGGMLRGLLPDAVSERSVPLLGPNVVYFGVGALVAWLLIGFLG